MLNKDRQYNGQTMMFITLHRKQRGTRRRMLNKDRQYNGQKMMFITLHRKLKRNQKAYVE